MDERDEREERLRWEARHARGESLAPPSRFVSEHVGRLRDPDRRQRALDVACGSGRHTSALVAAGFSSFALDVSRSAVRRSTMSASAVAGVIADALELPFRPGAFDLIVMTCFLERTIIAPLAALLVPGGHLLIETFHLAQHELTGHPRREFCLTDGELEELCGASDPALRVVASHQRSPGQDGDPPALAGVLACRG